MKLINLEERPWGRFYIIHEDSSYKLKRIEVDPGGRLSISIITNALRLGPL